jgi:hypothetical protein
MAKLNEMGFNFLCFEFIQQFHKKKFLHQIKEFVERTKKSARNVRNYRDIVTFLSTFCFAFAKTHHSWNDSLHLNFKRK